MWLFTEIQLGVHMQLKYLSIKLKTIDRTEMIRALIELVQGAAGHLQRVTVKS